MRHCKIESQAAGHNLHGGVILPCVQATPIKPSPCIISASKSGTAKTVLAVPLAPAL